MPTINMLAGHYEQNPDTGKTELKTSWVSFYADALRNRLCSDRNLGDLTDTSKALENLHLTGNVTTHNHKTYDDGIKNLEAELKDTENRLKQQISDAKATASDSRVSREYDFKSLRDQMYGLISDQVNSNSSNLQQEQDARTRQDNYLLGLIERKDNEHKDNEAAETAARRSGDNQLNNALTKQKEDTQKSLNDIKSYAEQRYNDLANTIATMRNEIKEEAVKAAQQNAMPVGCVMAWPLNKDIPDGYLECNGQVVNTTEYPLLASLMASTPDMRAVFLQGSNTAGQLIESGLPNLTGYVYAFTGHKAGEQETDGKLFTVGTATHSSQTTPGAEDGYIKEVLFDASKGNAVYGKSDTVQPPAYTVKWIIKGR